MRCISSIESDSIMEMLIIKRFLSLLSCSARNIRTRAAAIQEQKPKETTEKKEETQEKCGEEQIKLYFADWIEVDYHSRWLWPLNDTIRIDRTLFSHSNIFEFLPLLYLLLMWCRWFIASMFRFPFFLLTHFQFSLRCTCQDSFTFDDSMRLHLKALCCDIPLMHSKFSGIKHLRWPFG